jgi:hypothetical protein
VHLLAGADARHLRLNLAVADERGRHVRHTRRGHARDVGLAAPRLAHRREDGVHGLLQTQQEARHVGRRDGDGAAATYLLVEERDDRAARGQHVAVADADEARLAAVEVGAHEETLLHGLRHPHHVDGLARLVGRDADHGLDRQPVLAHCADDVLGPDNVGLHGLEGEVLARRHLLQGRRVEDDVGVAQRGRDAVRVAHVADAKLEHALEVVIDDLVGGRALALKGEPHRVLLGLVAREDRDLPRLAHLAPEQTPDEHLAERACPARHQNPLVFKNHDIPLPEGVKTFP